MRYLCSSFGSSGDVFPMLGLAIELHRRGHDVTFATNQHFEAIVRRHGLPFEALGTEEEFQTCIKHPDLWNPSRAFAQVFRSFQPALKRQYELHVAFAQGGRAVGITNVFGMGALLAQEKQYLPVVTVHLQPAVIWSKYQPPKLPRLFGPRWFQNILYSLGERYVIDPVVCPFLNEWRKELELSPVRRITRWWHSPYAVVCLFPEWFAPPQSDWPPNVVQTNFPLWNDQGQTELAPDVAAFLDQGTAPLVFTPGTANIHAKAFFAAAVDACQRLQRRGILLTAFPEQLPEPLPEGVVHFSYVPLNVLLPRCAAFIHHGGIGSASQAMAAGIPQVVMPLAHDQLDNATRLKKLNLGDWLKPSRFTGPRLEKMIKRLISSATCVLSCKEIAKRVVSSNGLVHAADAIERRTVRA